jgi:DNA-binding response OmpR family regulator
MEPDQLKPSILIVEDDQSLLRGVVDKFLREGFVVFFATNGMEGLASALLNHPDIILLDIVMPHMDGLTMLEKLRAENEWGNKVSVIFLTNLGPDSDKMIEHISAHEPAFYLVKSDLLLNDVVAKVREALAAKSTG